MRESTGETGPRAGGSLLPPCPSTPGAPGPARSGKNGDRCDESRLFVGIVINGLRGFRRRRWRSVTRDRRVFVYLDRPSRSPCFCPLSARRASPRVVAGPSRYWARARERATRRAASRQARIYFVYLFIDLFGMISPVITVRSRDIICMIMACVNDPDGRRAGFIYRGR